jgi:LmbE family N-acetylglucosaminyl deacetylase
MKRMISAIALFTGLAGLAALSGCSDVPAGSLLDGVKPGPDGKINVVTVFSHPDDETFYTGGTLLKIKKDPRVRLHIVCMTNGNMDEAKENLGITKDQLGKFRKEELKLAGLVLGADSVVCLDYDDQGLEPADKEIMLKRVLDEINKNKAAIIITNDPFGLSGHSDHIACNAVAKKAFDKSSAQRLYYITMTPWRYKYNLIFALSDSKAEKSKPSLRVDISKEKKLKKLALYSHVTQANFSFWNSIAMTEDLWYNYEYFTLAGQKQ